MKGKNSKYDYDLSPLDEDYNLWLLFAVTRRATAKARHKELSQYGITLEQAGVLYVIKHIGRKIILSEIARFILREAHTISTLIDRMVAKGLVKKIKDLDRKNLVRVEMTEKGQKAYDNTTKRESIYRMISSLSEEEKRQFRTCLEKLRDKALQEL